MCGCEGDGAACHVSETSDNCICQVSVLFPCCQGVAAAHPLTLLCAGLILQHAVQRSWVKHYPPAAVTLPQWRVPRLLISLALAGDIHIQVPQL